MIDFATRFRVCAKHHVRFGAPGKGSIRNASRSFIASFVDALSHVGLSILEDVNT